MSGGREVAVVIPTHNRIGYLKEAVASALNQQGSEADVIVVDDGSSDGTAEWLDQVKDPRLRWHRVADAGGGSAARNLGLAGCESPFVLFLDDDDRLRPDALARLAGALRRHRRAAGAAGTFARFGAVDLVRRELQPRLPVTVAVWREELFGWNMAPAALLWRTAVVRELGGWDESLRRCEDRDLNLRAYPRPFALIPAVVMDYRVHAAQVPPPQYAALRLEVLERFVATLDGRDRSVGERVFEAGLGITDGIALYDRGEFGPAAHVFASALSGGTTLARSAILGPWLLGMLAKSAVGMTLPAGMAGGLQSALRRRRRSAPESPEQDAVA
jgi:glycosyltransferase involved in cell wall biosynthesis